MSERVYKRRWEIIIFPTIWNFWIHKPYGAKYHKTPFLRETWIGPICLKIWEDPRSVGSLSHPIRIARIIR